MLGFVASVRPYAELLYFFAGIALAGGLALTYQQLSAIKNDSDARDLRSSREKAIEASSRYLDRYVLLSGEALLIAQEAKIPNSYRGRIGNFEPSSPRTIPTQLHNETYARAVMKSLNELETVASYFCTDVADEKTGFAIIGRSYCSTVASWYDLITFYRDQPAQQYWYNIVKLYQMWSPRLSRAELEKLMSDLEKTTGSDTLTHSGARS